ncbi:hypothetical protein JW960_28760 [candidate division KSB1 bacterium]|nr:hypothetical protein [candidate division KSB1 bacterium]
MNLFRYSLLSLLISISSQSGSAQDSAATKQDSSAVHQADTTQTILKQKSSLLKPENRPMLMKPTLPPMEISEKQKRMQFDVAPRTNNIVEPGDAANYDALKMPTSRGDYDLPENYIPPLIPITPIEPKREDKFLPLPFNEYSIPTREELDVLEILWAKEDVMDTTIYSTLDPDAKLTMEDLQKLLEGMATKGFISQKMVSPRFEFNAFGIPIEMSMTNRRNRVYEYRSKVDEATMKRFIDANAFLYQDDKSIVNHQRLQAARHDSTLLNDLNDRIKLPGNNADEK